MAFNNRQCGFDQNNNSAGLTLDHNTAWANRGRNFNLNHRVNTIPHVLRNNLSIAGGSSDSFRNGSLMTNNSWQVLSPTPSANDVLTGDTGQPFSGSVPDLGAFESPEWQGQMPMKPPSP